jgi:hypothetical protein
MYYAIGPLRVTPNLKTSARSSLRLILVCTAWVVEAADFDGFTL